MSLGKFQMTANCYRGSNAVYMLMLHSKCCINIPIGSRLNTWCGYIWNVPNLLSVGKWWVPSTRAYNVFKMFLLVSRPLCPQCLNLWTYCVFMALRRNWHNSTCPSLLLLCWSVHGTLGENQLHRRVPVVSLMVWGSSIPTTTWGVLVCTWCH